MSERIYLDASNVGKEEKKYLTKAIDTGYISTIGPFVPLFESRFARYLGLSRAVSTQSGTAALHIALYELGIGRGDEVIVPALTFVATVNPVMYVGARPVFADVDPRTWNMDTKAVERSVTRRTRAIIPVHFYGNPCDMDGITKIARRHGLAVIEDASESLGAIYKGRHTGTLSDFGCFSFNGNKVMTTGGGGMVVSKRERNLGHIKFLVNQARDESKGYYHPEVGFNYRMTNIEAALGLAQLGKLKEFLAKKRAFNRIYREELEAVRSISFQENYEGGVSSCWLTCVTFNTKTDIPSFQKKMRKRGIPTRRIFMPVTDFPPYKISNRSKFANSYAIYERGICLPGSTLNDEEDILTACAVIKEVLG